MKNEELTITRQDTGYTVRLDPEAATYDEQAAGRTIHAFTSLKDLIAWMQGFMRV